MFLATKNKGGKGFHSQKFQCLDPTIQKNVKMEKKLVTANS